MCKTQSKGDAGSIYAIMGCGVCRFAPETKHNNVMALLITEKPDCMLFCGTINTQQTKIAVPCSLTLANGERYDERNSSYSNS